MLLGKIFLKAGNDRQAEKTFAEAFATADASRHDEVRAEVAEALVYVVGYQAARFDEAYRWEQIAMAILSRLGGHDLLRAWLFNDLACVLSQQGRHPEAIQSAMRAIDFKTKTLGSEHPDVGISEINVAIALQAGLVPKRHSRTCSELWCSWRRDLGPAIQTSRHRSWMAAKYERSRPPI